MVKCPGYNKDVLTAVETGLGLGTGATGAAAEAQAQQEAEGKALSKALGQFGKYMCPPPCISIPIPHLVASGASVIAEVTGSSGPSSAFGWAKAQLDVLCIPIPVPGTTSTDPVSATLPGEIAPVTEHSRH
jgi:hypothetical protein